MENTNTKQTDSKKPVVKFENCDTAGDNIKALVDYYTNSVLGDFILSRALEEVKKNNVKIEEFKQNLLRGDSQ